LKHHQYCFDVRHGVITTQTNKSQLKVITIKFVFRHLQKENKTHLHGLM